MSTEESNAVIFKNAPPLDEVCDLCNGEGEVMLDGYSSPRTVKCGNCEGFGRYPTEFGRAVLAFVLSRIKVTAKVG